MKYTKIILLFIILSLGQMGMANGPKQIVSFRGTWKFYVGDHEDFAKTNFNDSNWDDINVPDSW